MFFAKQLVFFIYLRLLHNKFYEIIIKQYTGYKKSKSILLAFCYSGFLGSFLTKYFLSFNESGKYCCLT